MAMDSLVGTVIDTYRLMSRLGAGGMGVVYKAHDTSLDRMVALKMLTPELAEDQQFLQRFRTEARSLARIHDPAIVTVYALREAGDHVFIAMEYVDGVTLEEKIKQAGPMPVVEAAPLFLDLLNALGRAHQAGVIHRDIKPANIMISREGGVKILDFGLAHLQSSDLHLTQASTTGGTPYYMPPEQFKGLKFVDQRSDLYALGMTLYLALTGRLPLSGTSLLEVMHEVTQGDFAPPHQFKPDLPEALSQVVMKAVAKDPAHRYQTATALHAALAPWASETQPAPSYDMETIILPKAVDADAAGVAEEEPRPAEGTAVPETLVSVKKADATEGVEEERPPAAESPPAPETPAPIKKTHRPLIAIGVVVLLGVLGFLARDMLFDAGPEAEAPRTMAGSLLDSAATPEAEATLTEDTTAATAPVSPNEDLPPPRPAPSDPQPAVEDTPSAPQATLQTNGVVLSDGASLGTGTVTVEAGTPVAVRCERNGIRAEQTITLTEGEERTVTCFFEQRINFAILGETGPTRGALQVDGTPVEQLYQYPLAAGVHQITVQKAGYALAEAEVNGSKVPARLGVVEVRIAPAFEQQDLRIVLRLKKN